MSMREPTTEQLLEQRIKVMLGEQLFTIAALSVQLAQANDTIEKLKAAQAEKKD